MLKGGFSESVREKNLDRHKKHNEDRWGGTGRTWCRTDFVKRRLKQVSVS